MRPNSLFGLFGEALMSGSVLGSGCLEPNPVWDAVTESSASAGLTSASDSDASTQGAMRGQSADALRGVDTGDLTGKCLHELILASENTGELDVV